MGERHPRRDHIGRRDFLAVSGAALALAGAPSLAAGQSKRRGEISAGLSERMLTLDPATRSPGPDAAQAATTAGAGEDHLLIQVGPGLPPPGLLAAPTVGAAPRGPGSGDRGHGQHWFFGRLSQPQDARARNVKVTWTALPIGFKNDE
jgi:hypothetical protein